MPDLLFLGLRLVFENHIDDVRPPSVCPRCSSRYSKRASCHRYHAVAPVAGHQSLSRNTSSFGGCSGMTTLRRPMTLPFVQTCPSGQGARRVARLASRRNPLRRACRSTRAGLLASGRTATVPCRRAPSTRRGRSRLVQPVAAAGRRHVAASSRTPLAVPSGPVRRAVRAVGDRSSRLLLLHLGCSESPRGAG